VRVLFTTPAGAGHVNPMVPLAQTMARRGHTVLWAAPPRAIEQIERAGIRAAAAGPPNLVWPAQVIEMFPELRALAPADVPAVMFSKLFGAITAPPMLADLAPLALDWRPDLVVADQAELAGHIVAAEIGVPSVTKGFGMLLPADRVALAADEVAPLWQARGLQPRPYAGCYDHLYLDIYPPELQPQTAPHVPRRQLMRPVSYDGPTDDTTPLPLPEARPDAPLVYVTMGTVFNDPTLFGDVVTAVAELDVRVLVTVGPQGDPAALGEQPAHVRVEQFVPQTRVLPHCDVVVSHAGSGTALATLGLGLPQLCLPQGADQFQNAAAIAEAGAGLALMPGKAGVEVVRAAVARLLADRSFRDVSVRVGASIAAMPPLDEVAAVLETLA
jgi:UDP:flavonoid glycosyltransferase YjiC (YdhE family)